MNPSNKFERDMYASIIYEERFKNFLKSKDKSELKIGTNGDPIISCYNSALTLFRRVLLQDPTFDSFNKVIEILMNEYQDLDESMAIEKLMEDFGFSLYSHIEIKDIYRKIMFNQLVYFYSNSINQDIINQQFGTDELMLIFKSNADIKKYYKKNIEEIDDITFLKEAEKELLKKDLLYNSDAKQSYHVFLTDGRLPKNETIVEDFLSLLKKGNIELQRSDRKFMEKKEIINYRVCNNNCILFIFNKKVFKNTLSGLKALLMPFEKLDNFDIDKEGIDLNYEKLTKLSFIFGKDLNQDQIAQINAARKILGINPITQEELNEEFIELELSYDDSEQHHC